MRELVELAADDTAATHHGAHTVAHALQALTPTTPPTGGLAMADTAVTRRLADTTPRRLRNRRNLWCAAAALTIPLIPPCSAPAFLPASDAPKWAIGLRVVQV